jgi:four helix bundle protein
MDLAELCYKVTANFPQEERFGLVVQIRKSGVSIPSNVAEGHERRSRQAYLNHVCIAAGSCAELDTQVELAQRLTFIADKDARYTSEAIASVGRQLSALIRALESSPKPLGPRPTPRP